MSLDNNLKIHQLNKMHYVFYIGAFLYLAAQNHS
jgi:hypothetical protein